MLPEIVRTPSLSIKAKDLLKAAIFSGALAPGAHLVETQLAGQFQISRGPIREALKTLSADGLVEIHPGRGAFVVNPTVDEMQDMIVLRAILNGMAARYAASSRNQAMFTRFEAALDHMRAAVGADDEQAFFDGHWMFYEAMYDATNAVLVKAWSSLHGLFEIYVRRLGRPYLPLPVILRCYETFVDLFRNGDMAEAEAVVRSQSLIVGFRVLERRIPPELQGYATREILKDGSIVPYLPPAVPVPDGGPQSAVAGSA